MNKIIACVLFFVCALSSIAQTKTITGIVLDKNGPLPGASIVSEKNVTGVTTGMDGEFTIQVAVDDIIIVSYLGYLSQEIDVKGKSNFKILLVEDVNQLDELVLIGYGSVRKKDVTGSITSIASDKMMQTVISSVDQGIQGKAAGVVVNFGSGQPGSKSTIRIRGISSITGTLEPLYVIDGVPVISPSNIGAVTGPDSNPLESLNPSDVESIEVLKDASATAIYGTRGANGVILVTTKRGKEGKATVTFDYSSSMQLLRNKIEMLNGQQLAELANEAADNAGVDRRGIYASPINLGVGTDWQDEIFRVAPMHNFQIAVRGGSEKTKYSISANYFTQDGIIISSKFDKANLRINLDQRISEKVKFGTSINLNRNVLEGVITDSESGMSSSVTSWALEFNPGLSVYDDNGNYTYSNNTSNPPVGNPVEDANRTEQLKTSTRILGNIFVEWNIMEGLTFRSSIAADAYFNKEQSFIPNNVYRGQEKGVAAIANSEGFTWLLENTLNFNRKFGEHSFNAVIGQSMQAFRNEFLFAATSDFDDNRLGYNAIQVGAEKTLLMNGVSKRQLLSYLGRINYGFQNKYLLTISARVDGSSVFGDGNKYGIFPSLAAAWRLDQENFMESLEAISEMKLRVGVGRVGNEGIPPYSSLGLLETTEAYFGENEIAKGSGHQTSENSGLKWETTDQINIGLDLAFLDNSISFTTDIYFKLTSDLLLRAPVPYTSGYKDAYVNIGNLENKGIEFSVNSVNIDKKFKWSTNFNLAFNRNKITKLSREEGIPAEPMLGVNDWTIVEENQPIGNFYGYVTDGIMQLGESANSIPHFVDYTPKEGDRIYKDLDGNGVINEEDTALLGNANPDFSFGFGNSFEYKNWSLNVFIQGVYGNEVANFNKFNLESFDGLKNNSTAALERWTPANPTNLYPRANADPRRSNTFADIHVEDGSYAKVRDITLSYSFASKILDKTALNSVKIFVSGKNLFTFTNYSGYDPEVNRFGQDPLRFGVDYGSYPTTKIFTIGANLTF